MSCQAALTLMGRMNGFPACRLSGAQGCGPLNSQSSSETKSRVLKTAAYQAGFYILGRKEKTEIHRAGFQSPKKILFCGKTGESFE